VELLAKHDVVVDGKLVPFTEAKQDIDLFLRSIWWNFRLRRYNNRLCIEIRTLARRTDKDGQRDLDMVLSILKPLY
jgi:cytidylate kinase